MTTYRTTHRKERGRFRPRRTIAYMAAARPGGYRITPSADDNFVAIPVLPQAEWLDRLTLGAWGLLHELWGEAARGYTDGLISDASIRRMKHYRANRLHELVTKGYATTVEGGYNLVGYLGRNLPFEAIMERKRANAANGAKGGAKGGKARATTGQRGPDGRYLSATRSQVEHDSITTPRATALDTALDDPPVSRTDDTSEQSQVEHDFQSPKETPKGVSYSAGAFASSGVASDAARQHVVYASGEVSTEPGDCSDCRREIEPGQRFGRYGDGSLYHFPRCAEPPSVDDDLDALPF